MANEYEISRVTGKCASSGRDFAEGEIYFAALFDTLQGFERKDYSVEAWSGPPEGCFCFWKGRVPTREKKPATIAIDNSILMNLFCRLEDDTSPMRQKFRFVLALLLMRKRLVRFEQAVRNEGQEFWQVRLVQEQSVQQVLNPHLSEAEIEGLSAQLTAILSGNSAAIAELEEEADMAEPGPTPGDPADQTPAPPEGSAAVPGVADEPAPERPPESEVEPAPKESPCATE
jgi:hypothetical protein